MPHSESAGANFGKLNKAKDILSLFQIIVRCFNFSKYII
jgi:hypothetical protein